MSRDEMKTRIEDLEASKTGILFADCAIEDEIHNLTMKLKGIKPMNTEIDCIGCGS